MFVAGCQSYEVFVFNLDLLVFLPPMCSYMRRKRRNKLNIFLITSTVGDHSLSYMEANLFRKFWVGTVYKVQVQGRKDYPISSLSFIQHLWGSYRVHINPSIPICSLTKYIQINSGNQSFEQILFLTSYNLTTNMFVSANQYFSQVRYFCSIWSIGASRAIIFHVICWIYRSN